MGAPALTIMLAVLLTGLLIALFVVVIQGDDRKPRKIGIGLSIFDIVEQMTGRAVSPTHQLAIMAAVVTVLLGVSILSGINAAGSR